ncbi:TetR/AcrR family transcriptional regulator [Nocardia carnea]|uniref:TetR/AcrR family transcriptional regulator n=1 Tax=Nocardia carnea TaxID=37328 RepID=A0ABW7TPN5_9NOCA|nr:TetR/AcrR family transcriptional regulator [Nocardia carnea]
MPPVPRATLRRTPRQQRSREMVERIIDAGQAVLIAHGYEGASTNRIAAAARISPGSLYQYFPNKDAVIGAAIDRYNSEVSGRVRAQVLQCMTEPPEIALRQSVSALLDALGDKPELLRAVVEQTPRLSVGHTVVNFEDQIAELTRAALTLRGYRPPQDTNIAAAAWMLVRTVEHLTVRYILDRPDIPRDAFLTNLTRMVLNYFRGP